MIKNYSRKTMAVINAVDYGALMCSVYPQLKMEVARALREQKRTRKLFCDSCGMMDDGFTHAGVGVVSVSKGGHVMQVLDPDLWIEAIDCAVEYMRETRGEACADAIKKYFFDGLNKFESCVDTPELNYVHFRNFHSKEFEYVLTAEAASRGLVDLK